MEYNVTASEIRVGNYFRGLFVPNGPDVIIKIDGVVEDWNRNVYIEYTSRYGSSKGFSQMGFKPVLLNEEVLKLIGFDYIDNFSCIKGEWGL